MATKYLPDEGDMSSIPWAKDYLRDNGVTNDELAISVIAFGIKGALVQTAFWKGFVWKGSVLHDHLYEACKYYAEHPKEGRELVAKLNAECKVQVGMIEESQNYGKWTKHEGKFQYARHTAAAVTIDVPNPFLPSSPPSAAKAGVHPHRAKGTTPEA